MLRSKLSLKNLVPTLFLAVSLGLAASANAQQNQEPERPAVDPAAAYVIRDNDHVMGEVGSSMLFVEYGSFACPHCATFQQEAWPVIKSEFVDTGLIHFVFRPMMTNPIQIAAISTILSECAAEDRYFDAAELMFEWQRTIFDTGQSGGDIRVIYANIAGQVGLDEAAMDACLADPGNNEMLSTKQDQANADGISGTPSFLVRGKVLSIGPNSTFLYGGEPLMIDGELFHGQLDGDSFRRIILHFLSLPN